MITCRFIRGPQPSSDAGVFGTWYVGDAGPIYRAAQLPLNEQIPGESAPPAGIYRLSWVSSTLKHPSGVYKFLDVPDMPNDELHAGNFAGNTSVINPLTGKCYKSDITGCTILGLRAGMLEGQMAILQSDMAIEAFNKLMNKQDFMLYISDAFQVQ